MATYYPYVVLETNVSPNFLEYSINVKNTVSDTNISPSIFKNNRTTFKKIGNLYQTDFIEINGDKIGLENIRDCVIIFTLYRKDLKGKSNKVLDQIISPNKIECFTSKIHNQNKNIVQIKYKEANSLTKQKVDKSTNTLTLSLSRNRIFQCIDEGCRPDEFKDPFSRVKIEAALQARLNEPFPDQNQSSLCGPAAYFFCLLHLSPSKYKVAVKQLWDTGETTIGTLKIKPANNGCRKVKNFYNEDGEPYVPPIDWITLASLRETENIKLLLDDPLKEVAGVTTWGQLSNWLKKSGFNFIKQYPFYISGYNPSLIYELNNYIKNGHYVITLVNTSIIFGKKGIKDNIPEHWIVWTGPLKAKNGQIIQGGEDPYITEVQLEAFTWGCIKQVVKPKITLYDFGKRLFCALVIKKDKI